MVTQPQTQYNYTMQSYRSSVTQEILNSLCNPNVYYYFHNSPRLVLIQGQINPIYNFLSYYFKIYFTIVTC
jgi:hypothetical protein